MPLNKSTTEITEADLEARIHAVILKAIPWIKSSDLKHQTTFSFKFGHKQIQINGAEVSKASARLDILITHKNKPLAVFELKSPDKKLTLEDNEQGLSYARMIHPRPPLVVISNGVDTQLLETHTGQPWAPDEQSEKALETLLNTATQFAKDDLNHAIEVLLGPDSKVWVSIINAATEANIEDQTGDWSETGLPFVSKFLVPREITKQVIQKLDSKKIVIVEGTPLSGKSNVLRDLVAQTIDSDEIVVLFVEADNTGILMGIANIMSQEFGWSTSIDTIRTWLHRLSASNGPTLVLAIDNITYRNSKLRQDIEDLTGTHFEDKLRLVLAMDDTVTNTYVKNETGRKVTRIGRRSATLTVDMLNDNEFKDMLSILHKKHIGIMQGGHKTPEFRAMWIMRILLSDIFSTEIADGKLKVLPPLLGLDLIQHARNFFVNEFKTRNKFQKITEAALDNNFSKNKSILLKLESLVTFMEKESILRKYLENDEIETLENEGLIKCSINKSCESIIIPRYPELLASEIASNLAGKIVEKVKNKSTTIGNWLVEVTTNLPFGDIIGAQALMDASISLGYLPLAIMEELIHDFPRQGTITPGSRMALHTPETGLIEFTKKENGNIIVKTNSNRYAEIPVDDIISFGDTYSHMDSWLILSHLSSMVILCESLDGNIKGRIDSPILLEIGRCKTVLRRPNSDIYLSTVVTHESEPYGEIVCHKEGIVEPITMAIFKFLKREGESAKEWIDEAIKMRSYPLLARIHIALRQLANCVDSSHEIWIDKIINEVIRPAMSNLD